LHLDKKPGKLFSVQTKGRSNSDSAWLDYDEFYSPMLQNILCLPAPSWHGLLLGSLRGAWQNEYIYIYIYIYIYVCNRLGETLPIIVKAYVVPGLKHDLLYVKGLKKAGYSVHHHSDPEQSEVYAVISNKIDKSKSFPFISEHSNLFYLKLEQMSARQFRKLSGYEI
jgi:hypothetical protein